MFHIVFRNVQIRPLRGTWYQNVVKCLKASERRIANEVIKELDSKNLQKNALVTGRFLISELKKLSKKYSIIGSVRGKGLFIGVELVNQDLVPEKNKAIYLVNRMKELGVLMSNDGLDKNVIKIKPPMIFSIDDSKKLILLLDKVLGEDYMISN